MDQVLDLAGQGLNRPFHLVQPVLEPGRQGRGDIPVAAPQRVEIPLQAAQPVPQIVDIGARHLRLRRRQERTRRRPETDQQGKGNPAGGRPHDHRCRTVRSGRRPGRYAPPVLGRATPRRFCW